MAESGRAGVGRRVTVVGNGGAGKTVLSRRLGETLGLRVIDLDEVLVGAQEGREAEVRRLVAGEAWVIDGHDLPTQAVRFEAADTIVFLDLPRVVCLWRVVRRAMENRGKRRHEACAGPPNGVVARPVSRWWTVWSVWTFNARARPMVMENVRRFSRGRSMYVLKSRGEVRRFLEAVTSGRG